jgi:hypothetical protein
MKKPDKTKGANVNWSNNIPVNDSLNLVAPGGLILVTILGSNPEYQKCKQGPK